MYFPIGWPHYFKFPKESNVPQVPINVCSNRDRSLFLLLTEDTLHIWFCKPSVQITAFQRSAHSIEQDGKNVQAIWKSDATTILVTTDLGALLFFKLEINGDQDHHQCLYLRKGYIRKTNKSYDAMFLGEGIPALTLKQLTAVHLSLKISSVTTIRDELIVATEQGDLMRLKWDGTKNEACSTHVSEIHFSFDLQQSKGRHLDGSQVYITDLEFSPLLGGFVVVLSDGRGFFLTAPNAKFDRHHLQGVWAPEIRDATCVHANHKYRLLVFGCRSGKGVAFLIEPATGALQVSHELKVSSKEYPDAGLLGGALTHLQWTPDECAIVCAWEKGGVALWSVFGALLYCSLRSPHEFPSPCTDRFIVRSMEWGAEGYQLWLSVSPSNPTQARTYDFMQMQFVKSPLSSNPCKSNHKHLFLQGEDKLYINLGGDVERNTQVDACSILIGNKQWRVATIKYTYLGSNWPIRYSSIDDQGLNLAIAGRTGLAHYSLVRRKWMLFGNEAQEKSLVVSGGLVWWKEFICAGCFNLTEQKDEIRFYPITRKLDNSFCSISKVPFAILLINTCRDYLICLCADRHLMIFTMERLDHETMPKVALHHIQEVNVDSFIVHPMCVTFITLTSLRTETNMDSKEPPDIAPLVSSSVLMNVSGKLLMFQRDWSGPQPIVHSSKITSTKSRPVPFGNPMMVASSVENIWLGEDSESLRKQLSESLWIGSGAHGMKVWLPLITQETVQTHSFMSKRIMLPFDVDIYPLAVLAEEAVILGAASDNVSMEPLTPANASTWCHEALPFSTLERASQVYLHHVLRQLLRRNLGYHALQLALCFTSLPYFSHILELLLHEVLEEEATSKEPIPDPLLPRVVAFSKEFPQYRQTVVHCARKTEVALWDFLFSTVGSPKILFEECIVAGDLDTAASYLIILQNLEKYYISRQHATLLLESALEKRYWSLARDVVRFLNAIDPQEAEVEPVTRALPPRYGQRFSSPPLEVEGEPFTLAKPPLVRNPSLSFYEADARAKEKPKTDQAAAPRKQSTAIANLTATVSTSKLSDESHNVDSLLYRHARKLLSTYRIRDLGLFAANLEDYQLVGFLRREKHRGAKVEDSVLALKQLHSDFSWPLPILTHSAFYRDITSLSSRPSASNLRRTFDRDDFTDGDLGESVHSTDDIVLTADTFTRGGTPDPSEGISVDNTSEAGLPDDLERVMISDLSRSSSDSNLERLSMELANRGPRQSELELRYLYQVMLEAECFDWCLLLSLLLRDAALFARTVHLAVSSEEVRSTLLSRLSSAISKLTDWINSECLGYRPFLQSVSDQINRITDECRNPPTMPPVTASSRSRINSVSSNHSEPDHEELTVTAATPADGTASVELESPRSLSTECTIS